MPFVLRVRYFLNGTLMSKNSRRRKMVIAGLALVVFGLVGKALMAIISGQLGWQNYWGGFVFAPFALIIAALLAIVAVKKQRQSPTQQKKRKD